MTELPSGTVTFLFTDIEGSTRLWQDEPEAMRPALARHDEILRAAIASHDGHLVKTTGDGAHAVFTTASNGVDAAITAQRAITAEAWPLPAPLRVRMGLHSGPAELRDGDYYGTSVNRAARIMSVAHGSQIVISATTQGLIRDTTVETVDLGDHRLKDLGEPERIYQIVHPGLEREFPRLRSLGGFTTNLPAQRSSFVGRTEELPAVIEALADGRLLTLTGVGGVGKTRLAMQVAADLLSEFPDGVWLVELAAVADPAAVPEAVATTLGLVPQAGFTTTATVAEGLAGRHSLLVLDNCEHLIDAAADLVGAILDRPGPAKVLATSREGLRLPEERLWPVPSLGRAVDGDDAVALFVDRARAVVPDFAMDSPGTADAVTEICRRLDGIPLAIELAAARTIAMSAPELRDRLDDRFRLLAGSRRGMERHQTLRHAVQWSYDLLDDDERTLLDRCAVFAGGFDLPAATAVAGDDELDEYAVLDGLEALVRKSLVTMDRSSGRTRYGMLETIRQFAEDRLADAGHLAAIQARHARHYAERSRAAIAAWAGEGPAEDLRQYDDLAANLRVAFRAAADEGDLDTAATIATFGAALGYTSERYEPAAWADELIEPARVAEHPMLAALYTAAATCGAYGRLDDAVAHADHALALLADPRAEVLPFGVGTPLVSPAYATSGLFDRWFEFCRAEMDRSEDRILYAEIIAVIALAFARRFDEATAVAGELVAEAEARGNRYWLATALLGYCLAFFDRDPPAALAAMRRAAAISLELDQAPAGNAAILARVEAAHGQLGAAFAACDDSLRAYFASGDRGASSTAVWVLASLLHRIGLDEPAAVLTGTAVAPHTTHVPEAVADVDDLRATLGEEQYEYLAERGRAMDNATAFRYALDQIEAARAAG